MGYRDLPPQAEHHEALCLKVSFVPVICTGGNLCLSSLVHLHKSQSQSGPKIVIPSMEEQDEISDTTAYLKDCGVQERTEAAKRCGWGKGNSDVTHFSPAKNTPFSSGLLSFYPAFYLPLVPTSEPRNSSVLKRWLTGKAQQVGALDLLPTGTGFHFHQVIGDSIRPRKWEGSPLRVRMEEEGYGAKGGN